MEHIEIASCPLCGTEQVQLCRDYNNPSKDFCRCRHCKCTGPLTLWNEAGKKRDELQEQWRTLIRMTCTNGEGELSLRGRFFRADGDRVNDENFDFDAQLIVTGDFGVESAKAGYAQMIADALNDQRIVQHGKGAQASAIHK